MTGGDGVLVCVGWHLLSCWGTARQRCRADKAHTSPEALPARCRPPLSCWIPWLGVGQGWGRGWAVAARGARARDENRNLPCTAKREKPDVFVSNFSSFARMGVTPNHITKTKR
jgi:hypothetical protein